MLCNNCGKELDENATLCNYCNHSFNTNKNLEVTDEQKNTTQPDNNDSIIMQYHLKLYSLIAIIIPAISLIIYKFLGLTGYICIVLSGFGYNFAIKGKKNNKSLSYIAYFLNGILLLIGILSFILFIIQSLK